MKNSEIKKQLKNVVQKKKVVRKTTPAVLETVEELEDKLEEMKNKKMGFYAEKV
jgi:polyhydroxyalkanoate synthesis regulator phasin